MEWVGMGRGWVEAGGQVGWEALGWVRGEEVRIKYQVHLRTVTCENACGIETYHAGASTRGNL